MVKLQKFLPEPTAQLRGLFYFPFILRITLRTFQRGIDRIRRNDVTKQRTGVIFSVRNSPIMDDQSLIVIAGIALFVLFGPWILLWRNNSRRKRDRDEDQWRWRELTERLYGLEEKVRTLQKARVAPSSDQAKPAASEQPVVATEAAKFPDPSVIPAEKRDAPLKSNLSVLAAANWVKKDTVESLTPSASPASTIPSIPVPRPSKPQPSFAATEISPSLVDRLKGSLSLEEVLGTNWLNKLGIVILVLGIAFFLAYQLKTLGPAGKILVGFVTAGVMLTAGIWFDRGERYRILARAGIGGGWALAFFTTYAMYHVPAAQVLSSQPLDLVLMLTVAAAMVVHTLRYRSQVVTGLAFLLAFLTVTISHSNVYSLSAGAVLAAALVTIVLRMQWFELEVFGILASYLNHYLWLRPIIEPMHGKHHPFPEFAASAGMLGLYWTIYRLSYVFRKPTADIPQQERVSTVAALLNTALLLALFKYQSAHPEWAFWALLAIGGVETMLSRLPVVRRRRPAVIVLSTLGVILLVAACPFRYSGMRLSVLWLVEAEALLLIGVWTKEIVFRRLGILGMILASGQMLAVDAAEIFGRRMDSADLRPDFRVAVLLAVASALAYFNVYWVLKRYPGLFSHEVDRRVMQRMSYVGTVLLLIAAWAAFPESWTAVAWGALGLALALWARRLSVTVPDPPETRVWELYLQANFFALLSVLRVLVVNLETTAKYHGISLRLLTIASVSTLLYVTSKWSGMPDRVRGISFGQRLYSQGQLASSAYTWSASFLVVLLAWYELRPVSVADAWMVVGLMLFELGLEWKNLALRLQAYAAFAAAFVRIFFVNLNAAGNPGEISPRFYTIVPFALGFFYAYWRLHEKTLDLTKREIRFKAGEVCCWMGTIAFAALMRFELEPDWVAGAWAALVFALMAISWHTERRVFLNQAMLIDAGILFRAVLHNLYERSYFPAPGWESRWITVGTAISLLLLSLPFAYQLRKKNEPSTETGLVRLLQSVARRPEQVLFFSAIGLLTALLALEMRHGMVTLSLGVEGVAVFVFALWVGERSFRLTGLGLLLLCVGKILLVDVWRLEPRDRYLTFIVLGTALLLVSFLYTRNREALRQYL